MDVLIKTVLAYLLGSILGSLVVGKLRGGIDIRNQGSGNAGGTNALRTQGAWFALWVMVIDIGKGWLAVAPIPALSLSSFGAENVITHDWLVVACAIAVVIGHVYPIWFGFRGGKGAATLVGVLIGLKSVALLWVLGIWLLVVMTTGFVGLATMAATAGFTAIEVLGNPRSSLAAFGIAMTAFVVFTHRGNIARMFNGNENRANRLWLLRPR